jgi:hypothetical protein
MAFKFSEIWANSIDSSAKEHQNLSNFQKALVPETDINSEASTYSLMANQFSDYPYKAL